jgi:hypothetical protein
MYDEELFSTPEKINFMEKTADLLNRLALQVVQRFAFFGGKGNNFQ